MEELKTKILENLYRTFFDDQSSTNIFELCGKDFHDTEFWKFVDEMEKEDLIRTQTVGGFYKITPVGVLYTEDNNLISNDRRVNNENLRKEILDELNKVHNIKGNFGNSHFQEIVSKFNVNQYSLIGNLMFLEFFTLIQENGNCFSITDSGKEFLNLLSAHADRITKYKNIQGLSPQKRGLEFQKLIAELLEDNGWNQEESVRTSNEEIDIIIYREREFYFVECKWEKNPIEASVIRELNGKITKRVGARGILISMSGFSKGATKEIDENLGKSIILLFGRNDIEKIIYNEVSFDDLLNTKFKNLITQRIVSWE